MATIHWRDGRSFGYWSEAGQWSGDQVPTASDDAVINRPGAYKVFILKAASAKSLTVTDSEATVIDETSLTLGSTLDLTRGTLELVGGGEIVGGTLRASHGTFDWVYGTLSGVTFEGPLNLTEQNSVLHIEGGLTVTAASGAGPGVINAGNEADLDVAGGVTLDDATLNLGSADFSAFGPGAVTLGAHFNTIVRGDGGFLLGELVNEGVVVDVGRSDAIEIEGDFTNEGSVVVGDQATLSNVGPDPFSNAIGGTIAVRDATVLFETPSWSNAGTITLGAGASADVDSEERFLTWTNTGTISVNKSASLTLGGQFTSASLSNIVGGGTVEIEGVVNNVGSTLDVGVGASDPNIVANGAEFVRGSIVSRGAGLELGDDLVSGGIHLAGVTFDGDLDLSAPDSVATISNGFAENGVNGTGSGKIDLTGAGSYISASGGERFSTATLDIGAAGAGAALYVDDTEAAQSVLSLGVHFTIVQTGQLASLAEFGGRDAGSGLVNDGSILAGFAGGTFSISTPLSSSAIVMRNFTNNGSITVSNGDTFELQAQKFTNLSHSILTGGSYEVDAGSTLELADNAEIVTDDASIILSGAGSTIQALDTKSSDQATLDATLAGVGAGGVLEILGGRDWTSARVFRNAGTLDLGGGTFDVARLANTGLIDGFGVITPLVSNTGSITAAGGVLEIEQQITGAGQMNIDAAATLQVDAASTPAEVVSFTGAGATLALGLASSFESRIRGFAAGDTIDLLDTAATAATFEAGDKLVITDGGSAVATLRLIGAYGGSTFTVASDGHGGTDITLTTPGPAVAPHALIEAMAAVAQPSSAGSQGAGVSVAAAAPRLAAPSAG
jgi:hypothetical protein